MEFIGYTVLVLLGLGVGSMAVAVACEMAGPAGKTLYIRTLFSVIVAIVMIAGWYFGDLR